MYGTSNNSATAWAGYFEGDVSALGYYNNSDERLKKDIKSLDLGLQTILKLRPVTYKWSFDDTETRTQIGLIAQEVEKTLPEIVRVDHASETLGVNYAALVPVLISAIQEHRRMTQEQDKRFAALERASTKSLASLASSSGALLPLLGLVPMFVWARRRKP